MALCDCLAGMFLLWLLISLYCLLGEFIIWIHNPNISQTADIKEFLTITTPTALHSSSYLFDQVNIFPSEFSITNRTGYMRIGLSGTLQQLFFNTMSEQPHSKIILLGKSENNSRLFHVRSRLTTQSISLHLDFLRLRLSLTMVGPSRRIYYVVSESVDDK